MTEPIEAEDTGLATRIHENGKDLVWRLYEASAARHISLQRRDRSARKLALLLNPPGHHEEFEAKLIIAGGIFAERAACVALLRTLRDAHPPEADVPRGVLDAAITAVLARGPVTVAPEWEMATLTDEPGTPGDDEPAAPPADDGEKPA